MEVKQQIKIIALAKDGEQGVPEWVCLLPAGELETVDGKPLLVDQASMNSVLNYFTAHGVDLVIDYEHQTQLDVQAPAAAWIKELKATPRGVMARVDWNQRARDYVAAREYRYISPVVLFNKKTKRVHAVTDVALTNAPRLNNYPAIVNKAGGNEMEKLLNKLRKLFGLAETAGEDEIIGAAEKLANSFKAALKNLGELAGADGSAEAETVLETVKNKLQAAKAGGATEVMPNSVAKALGLADGVGESEVLGAIKGLKSGGSQLEELQNKLAALETKAAEDQAEKLVNKALADHKVTPAQKDWATEYAEKDPKGFEAYCNSAPKVIPSGKLPGGSPAKIPGGGDDLQQQVNSMLGVTPEAFAKYGPKEQDAA